MSANLVEPCQNCDERLPPVPVNRQAATMLVFRTVRKIAA